MINEKFCMIFSMSLKSSVFFIFTARLSSNLPSLKCLIVPRWLMAAVWDSTKKWKEEMRSQSRILGAILLKAGWGGGAAKKTGSREQVDGRNMRKGSGITGDKQEIQPSPSTGSKVRWERNTTHPEVTGDLLRSDVTGEVAVEARLQWTEEETETACPFFTKYQQYLIT